MATLSVCSVQCLFYGCAFCDTPICYNVQFDCVYIVQFSICVQVNSPARKSGLCDVRNCWIIFLSWKPSTISVRPDFLKCVQIFIFIKTQICTES